MENREEKRGHVETREERSSSPSATEQTFAHDHYEPVVWTIRAAAVFVAIEGSPEKVSGWVLAATIDIVVFEIVTHLEPIGYGIDWYDGNDGDSNEG